MCRTNPQAIGIDFGTTNSSVARAGNAAPATTVELTRFSNGSASSRSILYLEKVKGRVLSASGPAAIDRYLAAHGEGDHPGRLIQSLKSYLPSRSLTGTEVFGRHYTLEDLISRILTDLRLRAEQQFATPIRHATVGRPVRFVGAETPEDEEFALTRLRASFLRAGFESVEFELEPIGAAYSYQLTLDHDETILIGDFGGGTSDFSILTVGPTASRKILGTSGLPLAGDTFDAKIVRKLISPALGSDSLARGLNKTLPAVPAWIYANLERWHYLSFLRTRNVLEILTSAHKRALEPEKIQALLTLIDEDLGYQLHQAVQRTKIDLSRQEVSHFQFKDGSLDLRATVTRSEFEQWIAPELEQIAESIDSLLTSTGVAPASIDRVFLTGGTSFVPAVRHIFESRFPNRITTGNEFTSVAQGLALRALQS
ncbi:Hsp70 family protein [Granulicella sp. WH15]|uniref:Hsp70 family protein n=1 Tax=Granulicella sp. WH15 TaxID=2602070 RepID=UPI00136774EA|nr:Hsp70 family protein [Granulicella sp. WH15]QHN03453.1 Hsp70 family protein [Granulicella sp. WH15]